MTGRNEIIIRDAVSQDIDSIMEIERESFLPGVREDRDLYLKRISVFPQGFLVAQNALTREIGGCIVSEIWCEDLSFFPEKLALGHSPEDVHDAGGRYLYIASFGTLKSWRGRGIGKALFQALQKRIENLFPSVGKQILIVSENWTAARSVYSRGGFKETGCIDGFFKPDGLPAERAVIMKK